MKRLIAGIAVIGLALLILVVYLVYGGPSGEGDFRMGQAPGVAFGVLLLAVGAFYAVRGFKEIRQTPKGTRRKQKRSRRK
jgi:hypothetical protein